MPPLRGVLIGYRHGWPSRPRRLIFKCLARESANVARERLFWQSLCYCMPIAEEGIVAVLLSRNADVKAIKVNTIEGRRTYGGDLSVKPLIKGDEMTFLEIHYAPGVGAPLHAHTHESIVY